MSHQEDRNFDSLIHRFDKVVYDTAKGGWRLKLLKEDLLSLQENPLPLTIWDAGCGFGQISLWFAVQGHQVTLCDLSEQMLVRARTNFAKFGLSAEFHHAGAQQLAESLPQFDLVLFHAVLEWLAQPLPTLALVADKVKPGGYLSLLFYNRNAAVYKNVIKGGWRLRQLLDDSYLGKGKKLTPPNPQYPHEVLAQLQQLGFSVITQTGIRVFHDYLGDDARAASAEDELFELENRYCRQPAFRDMGRYIHMLAQRH
jgi:S-adenosylmethionine-dependent methyltransferase